MKHIRNVAMTALFLASSGPVFSATAVELMNEGRMNLYRREIREGVRILEEANRMDSNNVFIKLILARGYSWNNEWERARAMYGEVVALSGPENQIYWEARFGIAQVTSWEKKYDEAMRLYQEILDSYRGLSKHFKMDINLAIGDIISWKQDYERAVRHFSQMLAEEPDNTAILNRIAKIYLWWAEYTSSREYNQKILKLDPNNPEAAERKRVLDQIKPYTVVAGYDYTWYDVELSNGDNVAVHNFIQGFDWQYSNPLKLYINLNEVRQNSNEAEKPGTYHDMNIRCGGVCRINPVTYISTAIDYSAKAEIFPWFSGEISLSRKLNQNIDLYGLYKFTYDKVNDAQTISRKQYHLFSPGIVFYYSPMIYNKIQFYVEAGSKDTNYSVLLQQYFAVNPENIIQFYVFLNQGKSQLTYSDTTIRQDTTTYSASIVYTRFFSSIFGVEFATGLTTSVDSYTSYHGGINFIVKW